MNKYEMRRKFQLDWINAMVQHGSNFPEGEERNNAMWFWAEENYENFKISWEAINGKLED